MTRFRRSVIASAVLAGATLVSSQLAPALAAPPVKVGVSYVTSGGAGIGNNTSTVADMDVPAGKYHVAARGTINNQTGVAVEYVACNAYGGTTFIDSGTASAPLQYAGFAIEGAVDLPNGGTIRVECTSSVASPATLPLVGVNLVADSVAGIVTVP